MNKENYFWFTVVLSIAIIIFVSYFVFLPPKEQVEYTVLDDLNIDSEIIDSYMMTNDLIIKYNNPNDEIVRIEGLPKDRYKIEEDLVIIYNFDKENDHFEVHIGDYSDVYVFGGGVLLSEEKEYKVSDVKIGDYKAKKIMFPKLKGKISLKDKAEKDGKLAKDYFKLEKTKYFGDAKVSLKAYQNITREREKSSYDCNCKNETYNFTDNQTNKTIEKIRENCETCRIYENYTVSELIEINPETFKIDKNTEIYEVREGAIKIVDLPNEEYGYAVYTNVSILGVEIKGATWWNSSWTYKQEINLSNTAGVLTDYQVKITLNTTNFNYSHANTTGKDIRFTNSIDDSLDYWIETWNATGESNIWVEVNSLANATNTLIYMYYGNSEASSASNITNTFILGDEFLGSSIDASKWSTVGSVSVSGGICTILGADGEIISNQTYGVNTSLYWYGTLETSSESGGQVSCLGYGRTGNYYIFIRHYGTQPGNNFWGLNYDGVTYGSAELSSEDNNYHYFEISRNSTTNINIKIDSNNYISSSGVPSTSEPIKAWARYSTQTIKIDYLVVRNYQYPEPTYTIGAEETSGGDTTPPTSNSPSDASYFQSSAQTIGWILQDETGVGNYTILRNGSTQNASTSWTNNTNLGVWVNTSTVGNNWNYTIKFNDSSGNEGTQDTVFINITEITAPNITISSPTATTYTTLTVDFNVSADETVDTWWYNLNSGSNETFTPNTTITGVSGFNNLIVYANDTLGNVGNSSVNFTVDLPPNNPEPSITPATLYTNTSANCSATFSDDSATGNLTFKWYVDSVSVFNETKTGVANGSSDWSLLSSGNFSKGEVVNCTVISSDGVSNTTNSTAKTVQNSPPYVVLNYPSDGATEICQNPTLNVTYYDVDGDNGNVSFFETTNINYDDTEDGFSIYENPIGSINSENNSHDEDWDNNAYIISNSGIPERGDYYENYTNYIGATGADWQIKVRWEVSGSSPKYASLEGKCWNHSSNSYTANLFFLGTSSTYYSGIRGYSFSMPQDCIGKMGDNIRTLLITKTLGTDSNVFVFYYEGQLKLYGEQIGNDTLILNGSTATYQWENLTANTTYDWFVTATDGTNTTTSDTWNFTTDSISPNTTATAVDENNNSYTFGEWTSSSYVNVTLNCSDNCECDVTQYCLDTGNSCTPNLTYSATVKIETEGISYIRYNSNDTIGNLETVKSQTIKIDTINPEIQFVNPTTETGDYSQDWISANITASDTNLDTIILYLYNSTGIYQQNSTSSTNIYINYTGLLEGTYYLNATVNDTLGHTNKTETRTIQLDTTAPTTTPTAVDENNDSYIFGEWTNSNYVNVTLSCDDGSGSGCEVTQYCLDTGDSCTPNLTYSTPVYINTTGTSYIRFRSNDTIGHLETIKSETIKIDLINPTITINNPGNITYYTTFIPVNVTVSDNIEFECNTTDDGSLIHTSTENETWSTTLSKSGGSHNVSVFCMDAAGNNAINTIYYSVWMGLNISVYYDNGTEATNWNVSITNGTNTTTGTYNNSAMFEWDEIPYGEINLTFDDGSPTLYYFQNTTQTINNETNYQELNISLIAKASNPLNLTSSEGWNIYEIDITILQCTAPEGTLILKYDGGVVPNPYVIKPTIGTHEVYCEVSETENYKPTNTSNSLVVNKLVSCISSEIYAFNATISTSTNITTLNFGSFVNIDYVKSDVSDVRVITNVSNVWKNTTDGSYLVVDNTNLSSFVVEFGNYIINNSYDSHATENIIEISEYTQQNPYVFYSLLDEITREEIFPPNATLSTYIFCDSGEDYIKIQDNNTRFLIAVKDYITQVNLKVWYSANAYYSRNLLPSEADALTLNFYVVDAYEHALDRIDFCMVDINYYDSKLQVYKNIQNQSIIITEGNFDVSHFFSAYLIEDKEYLIRCVDSGGTVTEFGRIYVVEPTQKILGKQTVNLNPQAVIIADHVFGNAYTDDLYESLYVDYLDDLNQTNQVNVVILFENGTVFANESYAASSLSLSYNISNFTNQSYWVKYSVNQESFGNLTFGMEVSPDGALDAGLPGWLALMVSMTILVFIGGLATRSSIMVSTILLLSWLIMFIIIGWFPSSSVFVGLLVILGVLGIIIHNRQGGE